MAGAPTVPARRPLDEPRLGLIATDPTTPQALDAAILAVRACTEGERRFAVLLTLSARRSLDEHLARRPETRQWLRSNRAAIGTWCRGVAYVWLDPRARLHNARHLRRAPYLWATRVEEFGCVGEARAWLHAQLRA
jgi:hypothetical protein